MPLCWIFLLKRRGALSNVSFSPTRTSANPGSPPRACVVHPRIALVSPTARSRHGRTEHPAERPPESTRGSGRGQTGPNALLGLRGGVGSPGGDAPHDARRRIPAV